MPLPDDTDVRRTDSLNGFLRRWRRNSSHAGLVALAAAAVVVAVVVFAVCACQSIVGSGQTFPRR
jgi:hypothetical protein